MIRDYIERVDRVEALTTRYLRNEISEAVFRASLHGVSRMTAEDIRLRMNDFTPAPRAPDFEDLREEASRKWLQDWHAARGRNG